MTWWSFTMASYLRDQPGRDGTNQARSGHISAKGKSQVVDTGLNSRMASPPHPTKPSSTSPTAGRIGCTAIKSKPTAPFGDKQSIITCMCRTRQTKRRRWHGGGSRWPTVRGHADGAAGLRPGQDG